MKSVLILVWFGASYTAFLLSSDSVPLSIVSVVAMAQGIVLIGFNIMHDANHGSYSSRPLVNRLLGFTLDLVGGSSLLWRSKHNILHHTYTNVHELDDDLDVPSILRFSPIAPLKPWHRFQQWYAFPLYCLLTLLWVVESDFNKYISGRIGRYELPRPSAGETALFISARLFYFGYTLVLPMFFYPVLHVVGYFLLLHAIAGLSLSLVFQVAHVVGGRTFVEADDVQGVIDNEWAIHQVETTANFAANSRIARWYCGGLNYQIEHHLFPRTCHIHYPAISGIVEQTCKEFGIDYVSYPTFRSALSEHRRFLKLLGREELVAVEG